MIACLNDYLPGANIFPHRTGREFLMNPDQSTIEEINQLLRQSIGLNPESLGKHLIKDAVKRQMEATGIHEGKKYALRARVDSEELARLIDEVIVPESWFFRDVSPFECLRKFASGWKAGNLSRKFRALSIPCCTGEEPYSIALSLLDFGFDPTMLEVVGVDISEKLLRKARLGSFGANSFREKLPQLESLRDKYFEKSGRDWVIHPSLARIVRFQQGNLADPGLLWGESAFDVIFCRNVVIYLDDSHRKAALKKLFHLLSGDGILYVGHTETRLASLNNFSNWNSEFPASFCKTPKAISSEFPVLEIPKPKPATIEKRKPASLSSSEAPQKTKPLVAPVSPKSKSMNLLAKAQSYADQGNLKEALAICQMLLKSTAPKTSVYSLMGAIHLGLGEIDLAEAAWNKALYLDPDHEETLAGLLAISRKQGDTIRAENFARRLEILQKGKNNP